MALSGVGATPEPQEPQKSATQTTKGENGQKYSIFDNAPQDGTVSTAEQQKAFEDSVNSDNILDSVLVEAAKLLKINILDFAKNFAGMFEKIETDGSQESAELANRIVEGRIKNVKGKLAELAHQKLNGTAKEPPSVTTEEGFASKDCLEYFADRIANMGLDFDSDVFAEVFAYADNCQYRESSVISKNDEDYSMFFVDKYMEHDFDGNIKDTHVLDYLANKYAEALKNK